jgi:hypothetical protein
MDSVRLEHIARIAVLVVAAALTPASAQAGGHKHQGCVGAPGCVGPDAMPAAYALPGAFGYPLGNPWCYAIPIQAVYQFPAVTANQPGAEVGWLGMNPEYGLLGGRPYLYHP